MLIDAKDSLLILVDPQASLMPIVVDADRIIKVLKKLVSIARALSVPRLITEHVPDKLKPSVVEITRHLAEDYKPITKKTFSCFGENNFRNAVARTRKKTLVLAGIETHICVLQTAIECREAGYRVVVVADGVSSRSLLSHDTALRRMERAEIELVTWEMVAYEWMRRADIPEFKEVLPHIKTGSQGML